MAEVKTFSNRGRKREKKELFFQYASRRTTKMTAIAAKMIKQMTKKKTSSVKAYAVLDVHSSTMMQFVECHWVSS